MRKLLTFFSLLIVSISYAQSFEFTSSKIKFEISPPNGYTLNGDTSLIFLEAPINQLFREEIKIKVLTPYQDIVMEQGPVRIYNDSLEIHSLALPPGIQTSIGDSTMFNAQDWAEIILSGTPTQAGIHDLKYKFKLRTYFNVVSNGVVSSSPSIYVHFPDSLLPQIRLKVTACTDPTACNYIASIPTFDDKSYCIYPTDLDACASCSPETDGTGKIVDNDADDDGICDADELGADELEVFELDLYPNPSKHQLYMRSNQFVEQLHIQVVNVAGKMVFDQKYTQVQANESYELGLENLSSGIYMLKVFSDKKTVNLPWIKH